ncbi:hypothetical protein IX51_02600 [uncultured archaeon]|nr:hypothetical protein IX51_02600 [uncultured archaeon]
MSLWYLRNGKIIKRRYCNRTWVFVSGDPFDLDFLARQLDVSDFGYNWSSRSDVYGSMDGIEIAVNPSRTKDLIRSVERIGLNRKFRVFNGDLDPVMRFMTENGLEFFHLDSPYDHDPPVESLLVGGKVRGRDIAGVTMDGESYLPERMVLMDLEERISDSPMIIYDNSYEAFKLILYKMRDLGLKIPRVRTRTGSTYQSYGQMHYKSPTVHLSGKICIPSDSFIYAEAGLPGIYEISRTSSLPPATAAMVTPGTAVSTMEETVAVKNGVLVPLYKDDHELEKSVEELSLTDRGGIALQPEPGLYEDVYEIDFSSMYPSIIVRYNLSPETIGKTHGYVVPDTPYRVNTEKTGFLSQALGNLLEKRLFYKSIKWEDEVYRSRDTSLKWMLLTSFGYTGYKNAKFGKIEAHESITSIGRSVLSKAMKLAESMGFSVIHGIVDSLWIKGDGDVEELMRRIKQDTKIDIVLDGHYRWIVFLPARSGLGSLNRYIGMRMDGAYKIRGIELRRKDVPEISRKFQLEALKIFEGCESVSDIGSKYLELQSLENRYLKTMHEFPREYFCINMKITRRPEDYKVRNMQKIALEDLRRQGIEVSPGERIPMVVTDRKRGIIDMEGNYEGIDADFYRHHLYRAFECFDFLVSRGMSERKNRVRKLTDPLFQSA